MYSLFQECLGSGIPFVAGNCNNDPKIIQYMINRSYDGGATWPLGGGTGQIVGSGFSSQPQPKFGTVNALLGGVLHGAVGTDPPATFTLRSVPAAGPPIATAS